MINNKSLKNGLLVALVAASSCLSLSANSIELKPNRDYIVTETRPGNIVVVDAKEQKIANNCQIKEAFSPGGIILAPDNRTAYIIGGYGEEIGGYDITTCKRTFHANLTDGYIKGQTLAGIGISPDSKKVYVIYNKTKTGPDRYTVLDPMFSQFDAKGGLDAKAEISFAIPRQMTALGVAKDGTIYGVGSQLYTLNPKTKEVKVVKKILGWGKKNYSDPDSFYNYIMGQQQHDFSTLYYDEKYDKNGEAIGWYWGMTSVDLDTNKIEQFEFTDYETSMFSIMRDPTDRNIAYGSLNDVTKFDIKNKKVIKRVDLAHTYYSSIVSPTGKKVYLGNCLNDIAIYSSDLEKLGNVYLPGDMGSASLQVFHTK